jgi:PKD repeat protein
MLRGTRENISLLASISNCAGVMALCFLLLATTVVVLPQNLHSSLLQPAYAQQVEEEGEEGTTDTGTGEEGEEGTTDTGTGEEGEEGTTDTGTGEEQLDDTVVLTNLQRVVELAGVTDPSGLSEIAAASDSDEVAEIAGASDSEALAETPGITSPEAIDAIAGASNLQELAELVGLSIDDLMNEVLPEQPPTDEEPPATESLAAEITSNATSGNAPATISFAANASGGTGPYTVNWNFGDDSEESDEESVVHTFTEAGNYTVTLTATDSEDQTATDTLEIAVEESSTDEEPVPPIEGGTDKWGIKELYPTASNGPTWYIREVNDPTTDSLFYYGIYEGTTIKSIGTGVWQVDARSGTQEHGIRMHVDSPTGKWKNTEMTGYFNIHSGDDQFTMIARHGPSYHDNGGCEAYGYYALTAVDGQVFFKKKLYHFNNGYTKRLASVNALGDIHDDWVGMKFVVYDLPNGDVKLELWIDKGDMTNKWQKETELIDKGNLAVTGGDDCGRDATDKIDSGTRVSFRADNSLFDFKKLSVREIQEGSTPASTTEDTTPASTTEDTTPASTTEDTTPASTTEDTTPASTTEDTTPASTTEDTTTGEDLSTEDLIPSGLRSWLN